MKYLEVAIKTTHEASELVSDILYSFTDEGVSIEDALDIIDFVTNGVRICLSI